MSDESESVFVESCGERYRVARLPDFQKFREFAVSHDSSWTEAYRKEGVLVESRPPEHKPGEKPAGLNIVRVNVDMPEVDPLLLYDSIHDPDYRKSWDNNMLAAYNLCELDERNDIGYYAAKFPTMISNRDFCNLRSWMEFTNGEYLVMNHSEPHRECPEKKGFIRAKSITTGYYMRPRDGGGCQLVYVTQSDLRGSLPHWLLNTGLTKLAPSTMKKLETCAINYKKWAEDNRGDGFMGRWRTAKVAWDGSVAPPGSVIGKITNVDDMTPVNAEDVEVELHREGAGEEGATPLSAATGKVELLIREGSISAGPANEATLQLQQQVDDLKHQLQMAYRRSAVGGGDAGLALAPVAPSRPDDTVAIQQYRALMNDAINFVDRQYVQEGRAPSLREYLIRLHCVIEGMQRTIPAAHS